MEQKGEVNARSLSRSPIKSTIPERKTSAHKSSEIRPPVTPKRDPLAPYEKQEKKPARIPPSNPYGPPKPAKPALLKVPRRQIPRITSEIPQHEVSSNNFLYSI